MRALRERRGWLQSDLAAEAGLSKPFVSQVESGARDPSPVAAEALARALGVPIGEIAPVVVACPVCRSEFGV